MIRSRRGAALEGLMCFLQAFWPNMVTRHQFLIIRQVYLKLCSG